MCTFSYFCSAMGLSITERQIETQGRAEVWKFRPRAGQKYEGRVHKIDFLGLLKLFSFKENIFFNNHLVKNTSFWLYFYLVEYCFALMFLVWHLRLSLIFFCLSPSSIFRSASSSRNRSSEKKFHEKVSNSNNLIFHAFTCTLILDTWYLILETEN